MTFIVMVGTATASRHPCQNQKGSGNVTDTLWKNCNVDFNSLFCGKVPDHNESGRKFLCSEGWRSTCSAVNSLTDKINWALVCKLEVQL